MVKSRVPLCSMFTASFDDRLKLPSYIFDFVSNTLIYSDLHFITPALNFSRSFDTCFGTSVGELFIIPPSSLPSYSSCESLFNSVFFNYSTNSAKFELSCFHRWFALNSATIHLSADDYICLLDTDFFLGLPPLVILQHISAKSHFSEYDFISQWDEPMVSICPEITILRKSVLFNFCAFLLTEFYSSALRNQLVADYFSRIGNGLSGGICDMRALAYFVKSEGKSLRLYNIRDCSESLFIISNFCSFLDHYLLLPWSIKFTRLSVDPGYIFVNSKSEIPLIGIHFQGGSKKYIKLFIDTISSGLSISGQAFVQFDQGPISNYRIIINFLRKILLKLFG